MKTVAIAIPSLHWPDLTARCIESIQRQTLPAEQWKIVVIENEAQPVPSSYVLLLNNDVEVVPDYLEKLQKTLGVATAGPSTPTSSPTSMICY